jgi:hypothetical protein
MRIGISALYFLSSMVMVTLVQADPPFVGTEQAGVILQSYVDPTNSQEEDVLPPAPIPKTEQCCDPDAQPETEASPVALMVESVPARPARVVVKRLKKIAAKEAGPAALKQVPADARVVDAIKVIIVTDEGTEIILKSDLERPGLGGAVKPLDAMVFERLVFCDAKRFKQLPDDNAIDKYITRVMRENNLTRKDIDQMFSQAGYTYDEGREELRRMQAVQLMMSQKIYANVTVSRHEVVAYCQAHPVWTDTSAQIARVVIPYSGSSAHEKETQKALLHEQIKDFNYVRMLPWSGSFWVKKSELAANRQFIFDVPVGGVSEPHAMADGFELLRVLDKKEAQLIPLEERYPYIAEELARPKYDKLLEKYRKHLMDSASIVYLN